jgi:hypothetical protein
MKKGDTINKRQIKSKGQLNMDNPEKLVSLEAHKKRKTKKSKKQNTLCIGHHYK